MALPGQSLRGALVGAALACVAGCVDSVDLCRGVDLSDGSACLNLHVRGDVGPIDTLQVDEVGTGLDGVSGDTARRVLLHPEGVADGGGLAPPFAIAFHVGRADVLDQLRILALHQGSKVGYADLQIDLLARERASGDVELEGNLDQRSCFNGVLDDGETGTDCNGWQINEYAETCPLCGAGAPCAQGYDCVSGVCSGDTCG